MVEQALQDRGVRRNRSKKSNYHFNRNESRFETTMEENRRHFQQPMKDSPIDKSVTHLKNNAIRAKDSASHQQNNRATSILSNRGNRASCNLNPLQSGE
jgi:hypothetical protein